eukprot:scaffold19413_cov96-Skeletonema_dohrnii-CCMP3373.AAC.1
MNLQQPGEATPPPPLSSTAADIVGDVVEANFENSSDEEEEFVDHVSALLVSRQQQQQQRNDNNNNNVDQSPIEEQYDDSPTRPKSSPPKDSNSYNQHRDNYLTDSTLKNKGLLETIIDVNSSELASSLSLFSESETNGINDNSTHTASAIPDTSNKGTSQRQQQIMMQRQ